MRSYIRGPLWYTAPLIWFVIPGSLPLNLSRLFVTFSLCVLLVAPAQALTSEQSQYLSALQAIRAQRPAEARAIRQQLGDYPLALYIDYYDLYLHPDTTRLGEVRQFVAQDRQGLLAGRLKARYLRLLADVDAAGGLVALRLDGGGVMAGGRRIAALGEAAADEVARGLRGADRPRRAVWAGRAS